MKGLLLVTHSNMCQGIKESCEMIVGNQNNMKTVSLKEEGVEIFKNELESTLNDMLKMYSDIIILTDIPNATPYNECYRFKLSHEKDNIFILSGMNLAMVIELAIYSSSDMEVEELLTQVLETGNMSILKV